MTKLYSIVLLPGLSLSKPGAVPVFSSEREQFTAALSRSLAAHGAAYRTLQE